METTSYRDVSIAFSSSLYSELDVEYSNALAALASTITLAREFLLPYYTKFSLSELLSTTTNTTENDSTSTKTTSVSCPTN